MQRAPQWQGEERLVRVTAGAVTLEGNLSLPEGARGRRAVRARQRQQPAQPPQSLRGTAAQRGGLATLLIDLLTADEEAIDLRTAHLRFDIGLLAERLVGATDWLSQHPDTRDLPGRLLRRQHRRCAPRWWRRRSALEVVGAVVSRGGRPDLAGPALPRVQAPTLLIVGGNDFR